MSASRLKAVLPALVPFALAVLFWRIYPHILIDADTPRYLANDPMRTATYPLFLDLTYGPALLPLQLALFAAALSWLTIYASRFLPWWAAAAIMLGIGFNPYLWELQATIMGEALTTPLLTVIVGLIIGYSFTGQRALLLAAALIGGVATTTRPPCAPLLLVPLLAALLLPGIGRRWRLFGLVLVVWAAPVAAERIYSRAVHGDQLASPLGRHAFMKAAVIDAPPAPESSPDPLDRRLVHALNHDFAPVRAILNQAPDWQVRYALLTNYEACTAWACGDRILAGVDRPRRDIDQALFRAGAERLKANPLGYVELTVSEYLRMWLLHPRKHPDLAPEYNAFLAEHSPLPFQAELGVEGRPTPASEVRSLYRLNRIGFAVVGVLAAMVPIMALWRRRQRLEQAALALLAGGQAVLVLCALTAVGLPRYAMGMWPVLIAGILLAALGLLDGRTEERAG